MYNLIQDLVAPDDPTNQPEAEHNKNLCSKCGLPGHRSDNQKFHPKKGQPTSTCPPEKGPGRETGEIDPAAVTASNKRKRPTKVPSSSESSTSETLTPEYVLRIQADLIDSQKALIEALGENARLNRELTEAQKETLLAREDLLKLKSAKPPALSQERPRPWKTYADAASHSHVETQRKPKETILIKTDPGTARSLLLQQTKTHGLGILDSRDSTRGLFIDVPAAGLEKTKIALDKMGLTHSTIQPLKPEICVVLKDLPPLTPEELLDAFDSQNACQNPDPSLLLHRTEKHAFFRVSPEKYEQIIWKQEKSCYMGLNRLRAFTSTRIKKCHRCHTLGHNASKCENPPKCGNCSKDHNTLECTTDERKCPLCNTAHSVFDKTLCTKLIQCENSIINKTRYGSSGYRP